MNHQVARFKNAAEPLLWTPKPYDDLQGWRKTERKILELIWTNGSILPPSLLVDVLQSTLPEAERETIDVIDADMNEYDMLVYLDEESNE